jgi:purine-nucleoside phosphorylase
MTDRSTSSGPRLLQVFLCHWSGDKPVVRELHRRLRRDGFKPWLDAEDLVGGTRWEDAIEDAVRASDAVLVCLSAASVSKEGYLQREIRFALGVADEKPDEVIFIVPVRLEDCEVPRRLKQWQYIDYFQPDGYSRLIASLKTRAAQIGAVVTEVSTPAETELNALQEGAAPSEFDKVEQAAQSIRARAGLEPWLGLSLGPGLGAYAEALVDATVLPYRDIPHFKTPATLSQEGRLVIGARDGLPLAALIGRFHLYEGLRIEDVVFPVRVLARLGVKTLVITGVAGLLNTDWPIGSLVLVSDHINLLGTNALIGTNDERFGPRFPDMSEVYSARLRRLAHEAAGDLHMDLQEGVLAVHSGPAYETPAEIRFMKNQGADLVGMSMVPEVVVARHQGLEVLAICAVTNYAPGIDAPALSHEAVIEAARTVQTRFTSLLDRIVAKMAAPDHAGS